MDGPTRAAAQGGAAARGTAEPGGTSAGVDAAVQAAVDRLAADGRLSACLWLEADGRLRPAAAAGMPRGARADAGDCVVRAFAGGRQATSAATGERAAELCVPVRRGPRVVGVLAVEGRGPIGPRDAERIRRCGERLGWRLAALGGLPVESLARRALEHVTHLSMLEAPEEIAAALVAAALDVVEQRLDTALVVRRDGTGALRRVAGAGPLARTLRSAPAGRRAVAALADAAEHDRTTTLHVAAETAPAAAAPLRAAGVGALLALGLTAEGESHGALLLAGRRPAEAAGETRELLELLAAHAATCLRTVDLLCSLRERAARDPLTGLGHKATFHEALAASHRRQRTAVFVCDVDGFKRLNDTFGHQRGDDVLRAVAGALGDALRRGDTLSRIGGDEFAALVAVDGEAEALEAGLRLRAAVGEADLGVTVSIGAAVAAEGEADAAVVARADRALYDVKARGRDGVAVADPPALPPLG
jgi:diguanylate cyclase (GGDEF)-like protein